MLLMFSMERQDVLPLDDLVVFQQIQKLYGTEGTKRELTEIAEAWRPYQSVASRYMWVSKDGARARLSSLHPNLTKFSPAKMSRPSEKSFTFADFFERIQPEMQSKDEDAGTNQTSAKLLPTFGFQRRQ